MECDACCAVRIIYPYHAVGEKKGTTKKQLEDLVNSLGNGYICGNSINNNAYFYVKRQLICGDYIESQYYNPQYGVKVKRIVTEDIFAICYDDEDIV